MKKLSLIFGSFLFCVAAALAWAGARDTETSALQLIPSDNVTGATSIASSESALEREENSASLEKETATLPEASATDTMAVTTASDRKQSEKTASMKTASAVKTRQEKPHNDGFVAPIPEADRVYYVRSVSSNNANYKTRFSILHETPSPKRVAGERLYNLSDEAFRLKAKGNRLYLDGSPVFYLTGINKAKGNTGELRLYEGGYLEIKEYSPRFRGYWDADGTGENDLKITPSRLVSGELPARLVTKRKDGTIITDEEHTITFKAMAAGPYNGYWSDGDNVNLFLWGMSRAKLKSREFTYLGLDLGVTTFGSVPTGSVAPGPATDPSEAAATPITEPQPQPLTVESGITQAPLEEGIVPLPVNPLPGGAIPGNNFVPVIATPPLPPSVPRPNRPPVIIDRPFCERFPNDPGCTEKCEQFPDLPECKCVNTPDIPECQPETPVDEPAVLITIFGLLIAARQLRSRMNKNAA